MPLASYQDTEEMKVCAKCKLSKPLTAFYKPKQWSYNYTKVDGTVKTYTYTRIPPRCVECTREDHKEYQARPTTVKRKAALARKYNYGMPIEQYDEMVKNQAGLCALCGKSGKQLYVDHDHNSGKIRELLCPACNRLLPALENRQFLLRAIAYLRRHKCL